MKDDLISRQAAIDALKSWDWQELYLPIHFKQILEELPSAQPEREKGEWGFETWRDGYRNLQCSVCGQWIASTSCDLPPFNYCPNCGADMRG